MRLLLGLCVALAVASSWAVAGTQSLDLSGTWAFQLDPNKVGEPQRWFEQSLRQKIRLPGSTDQQQFGTKATKPDRTRLTRQHRYYGPAWYQKTIEIPESWEGCHVELFFERVMWETKVWLDDHYIGMADSLSVPHRFDLSDFITPGHRRLTLRIDNRLKVNIGHAPRDSKSWSPMWTMAVTDESQTTWNGVIGRLEIHASDPVWIERLETYPDLKKQQTRVVAMVRNRLGVAVAGELTASATGDGHTMGPVTAEFRTKGPEAPVGGPDSPLLSNVTAEFRARGAEERVEMILPFGEGAKLWDEFSPSLYELRVRLSAESGGQTYDDEQTDTLGLREFVADGQRLRLNGRTVFLRGNQDNCIHPLTGYPPMDKQSWLAFLEKHQDYGLNHMRFHSWCPPKAAFEAADQLGMMLQIESPLWDGWGEVGRLPDRAAFVRFESERILDAYGNHPSFCMFSLGNELSRGGTEGLEFYLRHMVEVLRQRDKRHLYTATSSPSSLKRNDDYFVDAHTNDGPARGLTHWEGRPDGDYRDALKNYDRPFISHEIGQYASYPDYYSWFNKAKYTGHLKAHYIDLFRERFEANHPPERGPAFAKASGALQLLLYKAEIEAMMRTPNMMGFHLNGLTDYPGEGVALIGMLDALLDSKGIVTPEEFRRFCGDTVPLARLAKHTWSHNETFEARAEVRHSGPRDFSGSHWRWRIADQAGKTLKEGSLGKHEVPTGELTGLGTIRTDLPALSKAQELTLTLWMEDSPFVNSWRFWVFPALPPAEPAGDVLVVREWNKNVQEALEAGRRVLLNPSKETVSQATDVHFWTVFWGKGLFPKKLGSMGLFCHSDHAALAQFPTRSHSDWQWYDLLSGAYALNLNALPFDFEPIVHVIDDFNTSDRLGVVFEAQVGKGRLLVCTLNLGEDSGATLSQRQLVRSLLAYAASDAFEPRVMLTPEQLSSLL